MAAGEWNFTLEQGADFARTVYWYTDREMTVPKDVTAYTARMKIKTNDLDTLVLSSDAGQIILTVGGSDGKIDIAIMAADTTPLDATRPWALRHDLELISDSGFVTRLLEGHVTVTSEVTT